MDSKRWRQVEQILDAAFDRPAELRSAYLDEACGADQELRRQVEALLQADERSPDFLDRGAEAFVAPALTDSFRTEAPVAPVEPGQHLGPYRLEREIGHGGMSVVYLAERDDDQFHRKVAVKLLGHVGGAQEERARRFDTERRIVASLNHANIAQVYDGNVTDGGWPYLVMEYVDGEPITKYCDRLELTIEERLRLFEDVLEAVQHAHQRLVIHRDLKPSNIYVTLEGQVKLLDFGIAKILGDEQAPSTRTGLRLMTPEYAAPEQFRSEPVTTGTDVYALGVILYELLTSQRPHDLSAKTPAEIERTICEEPPTKPSAAVTRDTEPEERAALGRSRSISIARLPQILRGDLDTIVLKALRKEPAERYGSVAALADDIKRYRRGLPVEAREPTLGYLARKFVGRHRVGVAASAALVAIVLIGAAALAFEQARTARERDRATSEAAKSQEVTEFVLGLFQANDPAENLGAALTARELLDRGARQTDWLSDQPLVQAQVFSVMGQAYQGLGEYDAAEEMLRNALTIRQRELGTEHLEVATSLWQLGELLEDRGDWDGAGELLEECLELRRSLLDGDTAETAIALHSVGRIALRKAEYEDAEPLMAAALAMYESLGLRDKGFAVLLGDFGWLHHEQGEFAEAEVLMRRSADLHRSLFGDVHPEVANALGNLAWNLYRMGDLDGAEGLMNQTLELQRTIYGAEHPKVAGALNNLAVVIEKQGRLEDAERIHRDTLAMKRSLLGNEHPSVASTANNLAVALYKQRRYEEAESLYREVIRIKIENIGAQHPSVANTLNNLGVLLEAKNDLAAAHESHDRALAIRQAALDEAHPDIGETLHNLGVVAMRRKRYAVAQEQLERALEIREGAYGSDHFRVGRTQGMLGKVHFLRQDYEQAEPLLVAAMETVGVSLGEDHRFFAACVEQVVELYETWGKPEKAAEYTARLPERD